MRPIPLSDDWIDPRTIPDKPKLSGLKLGLIIGLAIVVLFWSLVFILGVALLVVH